MQRRRRSPTDTSIINSRRRSETNTFYFVGNKRHEQTVLAVFETDIETGILIEADLFGMCFATQDQKEGMKAFLERRKPEFKGR